MTEQKFIKRIKLRIFASAILILVGGAIPFLPKEIIENVLSGYRYGVTGGIMGAGIATIINNIMLLKNEKIRQQEFIKQTDERNILISKKALGFSWFITLVLLGITPLFVSAEVAVPLLCIMGISVFTYAAAYLILQKKM